MISVELFNAEKHYEAVCSWWKAQNWPILPLSHLPQTGVIVNLNGKPAACAWIYKTDSAICWLEWFVADPKVRSKARSSVLSTLISSSKSIATVMGFQTIFLSIKSESLIGRIKEHGFHSPEQGMTNFMCTISQGGK